MWKLLKSEFEYYKKIIYFSLLLLSILFFLIISSGWESVEKDIPGISSLMLVVSILIISIRSIKSVKEKKERFMSLLPIMRWEIALARLLFINGFWLTVLACLIFILTIFHFNELRANLFWYFISLSSIVFTFNLAPFFHKDLTSLFTGKYAKIIITATYLLIFFSVYFLFIGTRALTRYFSMPAFELLSGQIHQISPSPIGATFFFFITIMLSLLNLFLYQKRKLYFE
jgi:hypothetical protein